MVLHGWTTWSCTADGVANRDAMWQLVGVPRGTLCTTYNFFYCLARTLDGHNLHTQSQIEVSFTPLESSHQALLLSVGFDEILGVHILSLFGSSSITNNR